MTSHGAKQHAKSPACSYPLVVSPAGDKPDPPCLPPRALYTAQLLIGAVRDENVADVADALTGLDRERLLELAVSLAALVPYDQSIRELLAWNDSRYGVTGANRRVVRLRPHGTHAAFVRHRNHGEQPCGDCLSGERLYQRERKRTVRR